MDAAREERAPAPAGLIAFAVLLLFTLWSASFIAFEALLTSEAGDPSFDWLSLTVARYVPVALLSAVYCFGFRRAESIEIIRRRWRRLLLCGVLIVPVYNFCLYAAQQQSVKAPVASLLTALAPLFLMLLSAVYLDERITARRVLGFSLALAGLVLIATAKESPSGVAYPFLIALAAIAPAAWAVHSALTKPVVGTLSPLVWTYLAMMFGGVPLLFVLPFSGLPEMITLGVGEWATLGYLTLLCSMVGFALWAWLLRQLPATSVGFTIFLNPPMTAGYKLLLAALFPAVFTFSLALSEGIGGALALAGVALGISGLGIRSRPR